MFRKDNFKHTHTHTLTYSLLNVFLMKDASNIATLVQNDISYILTCLLMNKRLSRMYFLDFFPQLYGAMGTTFVLRRCKLYQESGDLVYDLT